MSATRELKSMNCVVVEDQVMFLELLTGLLTARPGLRVVATARSVREGQAACQLRKPDLLLLDLALPDGNGLDVARHFLGARPEGRVIVLSGHSADFVCPVWLTGRLAAVISKNDTFDALRRELDDMLGSLPSPTPDTPQAAHRERLLTARELDVYRLIGEGLTVSESAQRLGVSKHTVHTLRKRIAAKLRTRGDELTRRAVIDRATLNGLGSS